MSDTIRIRVISEGPSDFVVLQQALRAILGERIDVTPLYPEVSVGFGHLGQYGAGWRGVLRKVASMGIDDQVAWNAFWSNVDLLVIHLDGDVAWEADVGLYVTCPPIDAAPIALAGLLRKTLGPGGVDPRTVVAVPMTETEAWLLPIFRGAVTPFECAPKPSKHFAGGSPKLVDQSGKKYVHRFRDVADRIRDGWEAARTISRAQVFHDDVLAAVGR